jgi:hypothetical protein
MQSPKRFGNTSSIYWAQQNRFYLNTEAIQSPKRVLKYKQEDVIMCRNMFVFRMGTCTEYRNILMTLLFKAETCFALVYD